MWKYAPRPCTTKDTDAAIVAVPRNTSNTNGTDSDNDNTHDVHSQPNGIFVTLEIYTTTSAGEYPAITLRNAQ